MRRNTARTRVARRAARWAARGAWGVLIGASVATLVAVVAPVSSYALDLLAHFAPHAILTALLSLLAALAWKSRVPLAISAAVFVALLGVALARYSALTPGSPPDGAATRTVRLAVYNAFSRGATREGSELDEVFRQWLIDSEADLVCVVDPPWTIRRSGLWPGEPFMPHIVEGMTRHGRRTITLLSRWPLRNEPLTASDDPKHRLSFAAYDSAIVEFPDGGGALFTAAHPRSPRTEKAWELSQRWMGIDADLIGAWRESHDLPVFFAGDFNSTPTSRLHRLISERSGLRSPTRLFTQGSWPAEFPAWLALPIDRVYVSDGVRVVSAEVGPRVYSDHRPVLFTLEVPVVPLPARESAPADAQNPQ